MAIDSGSISWDFLQKKVDLLFKGEFSSFSNLKIENTTIEDMVQRGWYIDLEESTPFLGEIRSGRRILLRDDLKGYERDLTFFHELVHAYSLEYFGNILMDVGKNIPLETKQAHFYLVEYFARLHRADPLLLRTAISRFGLKPFVYDRISLLAFPELCSTPNEQVLFPFCSPLWKRGILMRDS
ncbi:MAG: hypothetical protein QT08_C0008G0052 [archaeon GW2011_AR17]|nr:MAG: hypothetical protein QT08_C0008G0052 [archaeon GW2011_AR17]MBS3153814.1 hypothetical protein [Candidatus Woesearchaeota archaeon]HIH15160.1 hypothetical protein [Nanoarchaeota archaeon]HIH59426.1 hypothetical protein [Nanoarchaeota archaeon]HII13824.1 hypothetical protein [Nanoarchaeota archaeon]